MIYLPLIHGIFTRTTRRDWCVKLQADLLKNPAEKLVIPAPAEIQAGPFPFWNTHVKNPAYAAKLASHIEYLKHELGKDFQISIVAHSNGTDVTLDLVKKLREKNIATETIILIGAAVHSDIRKNGIKDLIETRFLKRAFAYSSPKDAVIKKLQLFPGNYGSTGARGFTNRNARAGSHVWSAGEVLNEEKLITRWFPAFGHSDYFDPENRARIFQQIRTDLNLATA